MWPGHCNDFSLKSHDHFFVPFLLCRLPKGVVDRFKPHPRGKFARLSEFIPPPPLGVDINGYRRYYNKVRAESPQYVTCVSRKR